MGSPFPVVNPKCFFVFWSFATSSQRLKATLSLVYDDNPCIKYVPFNYVLKRPMYMMVIKYFYIIYRNDSNSRCDVFYVLRVCVGFLKMGVDTDTLHAVLRLSLRLTCSWPRAAQFSRLGGVKALLDLNDTSAFKGFHNLAALLMRHVLEEPHTLKYAMEKVIRGSVSGPGPNGSGRELHYLLRMLAPASCRDHDMLINLTQDLLKIDHVKRPMPQQFNNEDVIFCHLASNSKSSSTQTTASPEAQLVIRNLLDALTVPSEDELSTATSPDTAASSVKTPDGTVPPSARRHLYLSRSSSANDMIVQDPDDQSPMESDSSKLPESDTVNTPSKNGVTKGRKPLLTRWTICKLLAEFVRCYADVAKLVSEHVYTPENTPHVTNECTALSYMLDCLVCGSPTLGSALATTEDGRGYVRLLVGALASCNHAPDAQAILVTEVKSALSRACLAPESNSKHEQLQSLISLICTMMETCPPHSSPSLFAKNNVGMNNIMRILVRKGVVTDLARIPHCLDLSSQNLAITINGALKALEMVARVMNHMALVPAAAIRKKQADQETPTDGTNRTNPNVNGAGSSSTSASNCTQQHARTSTSAPEHGNADDSSAGGALADDGTIADTSAISVYDQGAEDIDETHHHNETNQEDNVADEADQLNALLRIMDDRGLGGDESGGDDDDSDEPGGNNTMTLAFVVRDQPMDTEEDETMHDSRMVTRSESQFLDGGDNDANEDDDSSSSSDSSDDDDDDDDDDNDEDDGDNDNDEEVVDDNDADGE